jgi:hypothetical protein
LPAHNATPADAQFAKNMADGKYDWSADGKQQLMLPSEFKKACSAKTPCPVISWLPEVISVCWKIASELIVKMDAEKAIARSDLFDWIEAPSSAPAAPKADPREEGENAPDAEKPDGGGAPEAAEGAPLAPEGGAAAAPEATAPDAMEEDVRSHSDI